MALVVEHGDIHGDVDDVALEAGDALGRLLGLVELRRDLVFLRRGFVRRRGRLTGFGYGFAPLAGGTLLSRNVRVAG
jgi:hypothetical protein